MPSRSSGKRLRTRGPVQLRQLTPVEMKMVRADLRNIIERKSDALIVRDPRDGIREAELLSARRASFLFE